MTAQKFDLAIAGGGLSGSLIALALRRARPDLTVALVEAGETLGGNHRWSWFESDLPEGGAALLSTLRTTAWDAGYDVAFPAHRRTLGAAYRSLASHDLDAALRRELPQGAIRTGAAITALDAGGLTLAGGQRIAARAVIDCRGQAPSAHLKGGWQVFMGRHLRTHVPHGIARPVIMDATVAQLGVVDEAAYRFVYVLPLGAHEIFVEDTYYASSPGLDRRALSSRLDAYCAGHGWHGDVLGHETGVLPVITGGDFSAFQAENAVPGVAVAGARGGFVHPLTSYTLPQAVATALAIAADADLPGPQLAALTAARARRLWSATGFYRKLGAMLFQAARPQHRYRIFQRFYRLPEALIERFYAARSTPLDRVRILCGKPPVPLIGAVRALLTPGTAMAQGRTA